MQYSLKCSFVELEGGWASEELIGLLARKPLLVEAWAIADRSVVGALEVEELRVFRPDGRSTQLGGGRSETFERARRMLRKGTAESAVASFRRFSERAALLWEWSAWAYFSPLPVFNLEVQVGEGVEVADDLLLALEGGLTELFIELVAMAGGARSGSAVYGQRWFEATAGHAMLRTIAEPDFIYDYGWTVLLTPAVLARLGGVEAVKRHYPAELLLEQRRDDGEVQLVAQLCRRPAEVSPERLEAWRSFLAPVLGRDRPFLSPVSLDEDDRRWCTAADLRWLQQIKDYFSQPQERRLGVSGDAPPAQAPGRVSDDWVDVIWVWEPSAADRAELEALEHHIVLTDLGPWLAAAFVEEPFARSEEIVGTLRSVLVHWTEAVDIELGVTVYRDRKPIAIFGGPRGAQDDGPSSAAEDRERMLLAAGLPIDADAFDPDDADAQRIARYLGIPGDPARPGS